MRIRFCHLHAWLYAASGGRLGRRMGGHEVLLLTTTGRRSGSRRRTPVQFERIGDEIVLVAAGGGSPRAPQWWRNVEADPSVTVQIGRETWPARAQTVGPDRRAELWPALAAANRRIEPLQDKAGRQFPLVVVTRESPART